jgi:ligand-binding sensor domain-containing protein
VSLLYPTGVWGSVTAFEGLPSDSVTTLEPFDQGMWVGTRQGLAYYLGDELQAVWPDGVSPSPFPSSYITDVQSIAGRTWVATHDGIFTTANGVVWDTTVAGLSTRDARALAHDTEHLWAVTADGDVWRGGESGTWTLMRSGDAVSVDASIPTAVAVGAVDGVYTWDRGSSSWQARGGPTRAALDFGDGLWAGNAEGLWHLTDAGWENHRSSGPSGNWIHGMAMQGSTVYMTTRFDGVSRYDDGRGWRHFRHGADPDTSLLSDDYVFACLADRDGYKWFGDWGGSLARLDDSGPVPQFTHFFPDTARFTTVWSAAHDPQGPRWFGLDTGCRGCGPGFEPQGLLHILDDGTRENYLPTNSAMTSQQVRAIAFAADGALWVGYADFGVDLFADRTLAALQGYLSTAQGLRSNNVWGIAMDGASAWVATDGGLARFTTGGASPVLAESFYAPVISQNGAVNPLAIDAAGGVWLATASGLLHRAASGTAELFTTVNSPLVSNDVHSVTIDRLTGDVWIGTGEGVNRLRPDELGAPTGVSRQLVMSPNPVSLAGGAAIFQVRTTDGTPLTRTPIDLFDVAGRWVGRVRTDGQGLLTWDGVSRSGRQLDGGVYFLRALAISAAGEWEARAFGRLVLLP